MQSYSISLTVTLRRSMSSMTSSAHRRRSATDRCRLRPTDLKQQKRVVGDQIEVLVQALAQGRIRLVAKKFVELEQREEELEEQIVEQSSRSKRQKQRS